MRKEFPKGQQSQGLQQKRENNPEGMFQTECFKTNGVSFSGVEKQKIEPTRGEQEKVRGGAGSRALETVRVALVVGGSFRGVLVKGEENTLFAPKRPTWPMKKNSWRSRRSNYRYIG